MVLVQLLSAFSILGLGVNIWRLEGGKDNNLIETSVTLSCFVVAGAAVVLTVTIFLVCKGKDVKNKANVVIVKGKAVRFSRMLNSRISIPSFPSFRRPFK